jgi:uncharacterized protein (UPF0210 family)
MLRRRDFVTALGACAVSPAVAALAAPAGWAETGPAPLPGRPFRVRTLTAGVTVRDAGDLRPIDDAISFLQRARKRFEGEGYEVQTTRIATQAFLDPIGVVARRRALEPLQVMDRWVTERGVLLSLGPALATDRLDPDFAQWAAELLRATRNTSVSVTVASAAQGVHTRAARVAAETMQAVSRATPGGIGNFRFAASANVSTGTPFFPVAVHDGPNGLSIGLELAGFVGDAFAEAQGVASDVAGRVRGVLDTALRDVERLGEAAVANEQRTYLGIDPSPAPSKDRSIGAAIERVSGLPFGSLSTLRTCALLTDVLRSLSVKTCGYSGLMLPVLEDPVLAQRAGEGRYGAQELLLYSSVCGTGLDVVPVPGDTSLAVLTATVTDVAALSVKLRKALSARLLLVPGRRAGQLAHFDDPLLTDCTVFKAE